MIQDTLKTWHSVLETGDLEGLDDLLAEDAVFHSPVVHTPQEGKQLTMMYLMGANAVLGQGADFTYVREVLSGNDAVLEFRAEIEGIQINGVDMIHCNDEGRIDDFKVMIRPLKAINLLHKKMQEMLQQLNAG